tara:strand:- start:210 stop:365 length:156 start_codon:yes stop_codon:yes gene_type:complete
MHHVIHAQDLLQLETSYAQQLAATRAADQEEMQRYAEQQIANASAQAAPTY